MPAPRTAGAEPAREDCRATARAPPEGGRDPIERAHRRRRPVLEEETDAVQPEHVRSDDLVLELQRDILTLCGRKASDGEGDDGRLRRRVPLTKGDDVSFDGFEHGFDELFGFRQLSVDQAVDSAGRRITRYLFDPSHSPPCSGVIADMTEVPFVGPLSPADPCRSARAGTSRVRPTRDPDSPVSPPGPLRARNNYGAARPRQ